MFNLLEDAAKKGTLRKVVSEELSLVQQLDLPEEVQRNMLREAVGFVKKGEQVAHHLIPLKARTSYPELMKKAAEGGFDINASYNGRILEKAEHKGNHPGYSQLVFERLSKVDPNLSAEETAKELRNIAQDLNKSFEEKTLSTWW